MDKLIEDAFIMTYRKLAEKGMEFNRDNSGNALGILSNYIKQLSSESNIKGIPFKRHLKLIFYEDYFLVYPHGRGWIPTNNGKFVVIYDNIIHVTKTDSQLCRVKSGIVKPDRFDWDSGIVGFVDNFVKNYKNPK